MKPDKQVIVDARIIVKNAGLPRGAEQTILNIMDKAPEIGWRFDTHHNAVGLVVGIGKGLLYAWQVNQRGQRAAVEGFFRG